MTPKFEEFCCLELEKICEVFYSPIGHSKGGGFSFAARPVNFCPFCGTHLTERVSRKFCTTKFCCDRLDDHTRICDESDEFDIYYQPFTRRYYFSKCREWKAFDMRTGDEQYYQEWDFQYCIHCGTKLPKSLENKWTTIVLEKFGVIANLSSDQDVAATLEKVPEEFRTEQWWKKRGL